MRRLTQITVDGFRIFRERLTADLDANVVLVHGSNGCGKTSLLHAIEFALTGAVSDLDGFPDSYPGCFRHCDATGPARTSLQFIVDSSAKRDEVVATLVEGKVQPAGGSLSVWKGVISSSDVTFRRRAWLGFLKYIRSSTRRRKSRPLQRSSASYSVLMYWTI